MLDCVRRLKGVVLSFTLRFGTFLSLTWLILLGSLSVCAQTGNSSTEPKILRVEFDRTEVVIPCPREWFPKDPDDPCRADFKPIKVHTVVENPYKQPFILKYEVSGGLIVGQGENVHWNLEGVRPGKYDLSVSLDYGRGYSAPVKSETAELKETCCCLPPCVCPTVVLENEGFVKTGSETRIKAKIRGGTAADYEY